MKNVDIYLHFPGNARQAFSFYKSVFGGEFLVAQNYGSMPGGEKMSAEDQEKLMHISMQLTPGTTLMASDIIGKNESVFVVGNNFHICVQAESEKEADRLFEELSEDGRIEMPMNKTFWGAYFGMCEDKFGILWMINLTLS
jgi:PhnB protein